MVGRIKVRKKKPESEKGKRQIQRMREAGIKRLTERGQSRAWLQTKSTQQRAATLFKSEAGRLKLEKEAEKKFKEATTTEAARKFQQQKIEAEEEQAQPTQPTQPTQPDPSQEIIGTLPQTFTDVRGIETTINVPITKQQFEEARTRGVGDFLGAASLGVSPLMGKIGAAAVIKGGTKKAVQLGIKQQETVMKTIKVNRIRQLFGASEKQAEAIVASQSTTKAIDLVGKARGLSKVTKALIVGGTVFTTTLGIQVMQFWASVDNVAGLASLDALTLSNEVKFTDIPNEIVATEMNRINAQLNFARSAVNTAVWINPLTGWALGKFYKRVVESTQDSVNFKFDNINRARGT